MVFVRFFGESRTPQIVFEINSPLVDSKFKLFAPVLYCILGLKYVQTCWSKSHLLYWKYQTVGFSQVSNSLDYKSSF